jgi:RNA polymerase sigma-70 factor (ECF subfamily)
MAPVNEPRDARRAALFPSTRWSIVLAARDDPARRSEAFDALVRPRWKALYVLARKRGLDAIAAEDAVQGFLTHLLEKGPENDLLARVDPSQGTLRAYLKSAFFNHLTNLREHATAKKRGGGAAHANLDDLEALLASSDAGAEALFDRAWATGIFEEALAALENEFVSGDRRGPFSILRELFNFGEAPAYADLAREHGMTVSQIKAFVHRSKGRFRQLVRDRVTDTLSDGENVEDEVRRLIGAMGR